jgi:hypothetical protein
MLDAKHIELALDQRRRPNFFEPQFGIAMNLTAQLDRMRRDIRGNERSHGNDVI